MPDGFLTPAEAVARGSLHPVCLGKYEAAVDMALDVLRSDPDEAERLLRKAQDYTAECDRIAQEASCTSSSKQ